MSDADLTPQLLAEIRKLAEISFRTKKAVCDGEAAGHMSAAAQEGEKQ